MNDDTNLFNLLPKDIKKQILIYFPTKIVLAYQVETSDHDGYCSGAECEYEWNIEYKEYDIKMLPKRLQNFKIGTEINIENDLEIIVDSLGVKRELERDVESGMGGESMYCELSEECFEHNLHIHEFRITPLSAKFL